MVNDDIVFYTVLFTLLFNIAWTLDEIKMLLKKERENGDGRNGQ